MAKRGRKSKKDIKIHNTLVILLLIIVLLLFVIAYMAVDARNDQNKNAVSAPATETVK